MPAPNNNKRSSLQVAAKGSTLLQEKQKTDPIKSDHLAKKEGDNLYVITGGSSRTASNSSSSLTRALTDSSSVSSSRSNSNKIIMDDESNKSAMSNSSSRRVSRRDRVSQKQRSSQTAGAAGGPANDDGGSTSSSLSRAVNAMGGDNNKSTTSSSTSSTSKKPMRAATSFDTTTMRSSRSRRTASEPLGPSKPKGAGPGLHRFNTTAPRSSTKSSGSSRFSRSNTNKPSKFGRSQTRIESNNLFKKMDSDKSKSVSLEEISELMVENQSMWGKMRQLSEHLNEPMSKTAQVAARVALELATGKKGEQAAQAELTREEFHQFRKKYFIDPVGSEELFQKTVFAYFDADGSGELDADELEDFLDAIYSTGPQAQRRQGRRNSSNSLRRKSFTKQEMAKLVLNKYDVNGDETLSFNEVRSIISGGAGALSVLRSMAKEEEALSLSKSRSRDKGSDEEDSDEEDSDEEEDGVGGTSAADDPRAAAARLLGLLQTEEEKEEEKKIAEEMEQMSDEEEEEEEEEDGKEKQGGTDDELDDDEEEEEEEEDEEEEEEEEIEYLEEAAPAAELTSSSERSPGDLKGDLDGPAIDNMKHDNSNNTLQTAGTSSKELSSELLDKRNKGMVLREFSTDFSAPPMRRSRHGRNSRHGGGAHEVIGDESEREFDFCDWFDRKLSPSSYPNGKKVEGRKNLCERGPAEQCIIQ